VKCGGFRTESLAARCVLRRRKEVFKADDAIEEFTVPPHCATDKNDVERRSRCGYQPLHIPLIFGLSARNRPGLSTRTPPIRKSADSGIGQCWRHGSRCCRCGCPACCSCDTRTGSCRGCRCSTSRHATHATLDRPGPFKHSYPFLCRWRLDASHLPCAQPH
jgi:hypothetical protein